MINGGLRLSESSGVGGTDGNGRSAVAMTKALADHDRRQATAPVLQRGQQQRQNG